jgi:hypothetical protein
MPLRVILKRPIKNKLLPAGETIRERELTGYIGNDLQVVLMVKPDVKTSGISASRNKSGSVGYCPDFFV